jgi:hypothetical protein
LESYSAICYQPQEDDISLICLLTSQKVDDLVTLTVSEQGAGLHVHADRDPVFGIVCVLVRGIVTATAVFCPELSA